MTKPAAFPQPPDHATRQHALDAARSVIVQAPAGSGKTDLLTRRFLRLLGEVDDPGQIVAITFTRAAAAEMRHRILAELEKAAHDDGGTAQQDSASMDALARRALSRSQALGWKLIDLPAQLRISTIDSFCRELALQQPLLSGLGGGLDPSEQPAELYRRAARRTLERIGSPRAADLDAALQALLLWRDNGWQEMEDLLVRTLGQRDRWMHGFVLTREQDWEALRARLERPFADATAASLAQLSEFLDEVPDARQKALALARFACRQTGGLLHRELAELAEFPAAPFAGIEALEEAHQACAGLAAIVLTKDGGLRKRVDKNLGFPPDYKAEKQRLVNLIAEFSKVPGLESALAAVQHLPPLRYSEDDWRIVRACFTLLSHAAAELKVVFAESGRVDFTEVAQIAEDVLQAEDGFPSDAALAAADGIRHLLVDEFQDTSRRQHALLARLIAAWPEREGRTCFVVGDPMQSIYFFRDADAELFPRVREIGLEIPQAEPLRLDSVQLAANFRTTPSLVEQLNAAFELIFAVKDGSGVTFASALPARAESGVLDAAKLMCHFHFVPQLPRASSTSSDALRRKEVAAAAREAARAAQTDEMVALIRSHAERIEQARAQQRKYRIAVLGRARAALRPVAQMLREAGIPFRAVDLEPLKDRPEILDALALARALLNPLDRVAWLGVLRAPWCGLTLDDLHRIAGGDQAELLRRPVPELLAERLPLLSEAGQRAAHRVLCALGAAPRLRFAQPAASPGTWLQQVWLRLGGAACVDATARANLDLLWRSLDALPAGEQDLLGPALDAALEGLNAQPDPEASSDVGVQIMTIHKAKGLEFEVVMVPELHARSGNGGAALLSWLERGRAPHEVQDADEVTEFLVAPLQAKGEDRGPTRRWVDDAYKDREKQEMRRLLYVAATRAREELHLFARPQYKTAEDGVVSLVSPANCLLATAWPALQQEAEQQWAAWQAGQKPAEPETITELAASAESNLLVMPAPVRPTRLRRLPPEHPLAVIDDEASVDQIVVGPGSQRLYARHEGGLLSRARGRAVHLLLQELAQGLAAGRDAHATMDAMRPRIVAEVRAAGVALAQAERVAAQALVIAQKALSDPLGLWILAPHADAASEARWTGVVTGTLRTVQVDRIFRAGLKPGSEGSAAWWIVDYKTAVAETVDATGVAELRALFAPQIEAYGRVLRNLHGDGAVLRGGLYYPRMGAFDWWELE